MLFRCAKGYSGDPNKPGRKCIKLPGEINLIRCCNYDATHEFIVNKNTMD